METTTLQLKITIIFSHRKWYYNIMQPKKFSEYTPITETDGSEVIPILKAGVNATVKSEDLPISTATQTAIDAADADIAAHIADVANPHEVTKTQVGLGNADNTSDANKPVSTAQATAIALKADTTYVDSQDALKADQATTYTKTEVDTKDTAVADTAQSNLTTHTSDTSNPHSVTKTQVGLGNADNTSDASKPVSTAQQAAIDAATFINPYTVPFRNNGAAGPASDFIAVGQTAATANSMARRTATGAIFAATATDNNHATNKAQMDTADALKVSKSGDTMTGQLSNTAATLAYRAIRAGITTDFGLDSGGNFSIFNSTGAIVTQTVLSDGSGVSYAGKLIKYGSGFPNGSISGPVGSLYISDTAVTNGASSWIKKSGTGNTGWTVLEGVATKTIVAADLINGWTFGIVTSMTLRREGNRVSLIIKDLSLTSTSATGAMFTLLPAGYTASSALYGNYHTYGFINRGGARGIVKDFNNIGDYSYATSRGYYTGELSWITADAWPTP
jgi:hypothetical protein